jgi:branched-chain amino acid transport system ATP-binding protein
VGAPALLELRGVQAGYGGARVLHEVSLVVHPGETLVVLGRNGVGKTTLVETIMGLTDLQGGEIVLGGRAIQRLPAHARNRAGMAWVPQQREIFASLTVEENLSVVRRTGLWDLKRVCALFPRLAERRSNLGHQLSGGEQQMLAMGRALMTNPRLLLLDEPVEGLAPLIVIEMMNAIRTMQQDGEMAVLLVEQKYELALQHAQRCLVLDHGSVVHQGASAELLEAPDQIERLLGLAR